MGEYSYRCSYIYNIHITVSILVPVLFLIYVNDLAENLSSNPKLFADDTSYFLWYVISANEINRWNGLKEIEASKDRDWKWVSIPVLWSRHKLYFHKKTHHPNIIFNSNPVKRSTNQKHWGMFLDSKLDFDEHIKGVFDKTSKSTGLIRKLWNVLQRASLLQIYKSLIRPY